MGVCVGGRSGILSHQEDSGGTMDPVPGLGDFCRILELDGVCFELIFETYAYNMVKGRHTSL